MLDSVLGWFGQIGEWFLLLWPRYDICRSTHGGVKFKHGGHRVIRPGVYWWWPMTTQVEVIPVVDVVFDLPPQQARTIDGFEVWIQAAYAADIEPVAALTKCFDYGNKANVIAKGAIVRTVQLSTFEELQEDGEGKVADRVRDELAAIGVELTTFRIIRLTAPLMLGHLQESAEAKLEIATE